MTMFGFFRRKQPPPPPTFEPRSTSLVPGDLVVCIDDDWAKGLGYVPPGQHPVKGQLYRVSSIRMQNAVANFHPGPWLYLCLRPTIGYDPGCFRKAQLNHEPAEEAFTRSIRDLVKEPVS